MFDSFLLRKVLSEPPAEQRRRCWEHFKVADTQRPPGPGHRKVSSGCQRVHWTVLRCIYNFVSEPEARFYFAILDRSYFTGNKFRVNTISFNQVLIHKHQQPTVWGACLFYIDVCLIWHWHCLVMEFYTIMSHITPLSVFTQLCHNYTHTSLLIQRSSLGGSQWRGGRDFTLDLPLTALWAPSLPPWFSWPTWSSRSKPLIIPSSHPVALSLCPVSYTEIHICLAHLLVAPPSLSPSVMVV